MRPSTVSSHAQRREQFLALAAQAYEAFKTWYDQHPDATFAEIEAMRQALMGRGLEILINQRLHRADITQPRGADALCRVPCARAADWQRRSRERLQDGDTATFVSGLGTAACCGHARRLV
ncbi:hypothetical protein [Candidatus Roseilinea sp. NK_OTU-006]|jgi:hypothetical protein|uniref:hypothetical protein n=1 Tax=Candidatus Roseilinea sp. NK_OTU-006 TaxID=2704250 RepID=UPI00145CB5F4|nr:hypothetical protein [Candidatus Roseilinea sp. NK_OTU-006]